MRALATTIAIAALAACGGPPATSETSDAGTTCPAGTPSRAELAFEGTLCPLGGVAGCQGGLSCGNYSPYQSPTGVCRSPCSAGCPSGESCGADQTCQCTPSEAPCGAGDSCAAVGGMICHPCFHVCMAPQHPSDCKSPLVYSPLWMLCKPSGC